jgi:hypothetical protein
MKNFSIKVLISSFLILITMGALNAQFLNGFYNGGMPEQLPFGSYSTPFRGITKPNTTEWDGPNPSNSNAFYPILVVFVQFADDPEYSPFGSWPKGYAPVYIDSMVAINKNTNSNTPWWEKYSPQTEMLSSMWMEISRGKFHAISPSGAFSVVLGNANEYSTEQALNHAIFVELNRQGLTDWRPYDKWTLNQNGLFYNRGDSIVDCIYKIHRTRGRGPMPDYAGYSALSFSGGSWLVDTVNSIMAYSGWSGFTVCFRGLKSQYIGTCGHEHSHHTLMGGHVQNSRVSYGIGLDGFYSPYDMILSGYMTPKIASFGATNTLGDFSSRNNDAEGEILKVSIDNSNGRDECFLIANRRKISRWDRVMLGDSAQIEPYDDYSEPGKGLYIYHVKDSICFPLYMNDETQDMECADGYWKWSLISTGGIAKGPFDCYTSGQDWRVYKKDSVLYSNDPSELGEASGLINLGNPLPYGDDVSFYFRYNNTPWCNAWTTGKYTYQDCGLNIERTFTNDTDIIHNGNNTGDRYDAWNVGYNEVFSPYSSPSTAKWNDNASGIFIWYNSLSNNSASINVYKVGENGQTEAQILELTPPSRPMGIKHKYFYPEYSWCIPQIIWNHNMEPDMERINSIDTVKRYWVYRTTAADMNSVPNENNYTRIAEVDISINETPHYEDYSVLEHECAELDQIPPFGTEYPIRYRVKAVDIYSDSSVFSDFVSTTGISEDGGDEVVGGDNNPFHTPDLPKEFDLSQNYPNPFNPVTKINYALPKQGFVTLKIYDITGREVKVLVNEFKQAGYYTVDFNGSTLSSGVYFYRIQSGTFMYVKKMVLIK